MSKVKLHNKGERTIIIGEVLFEPAQVRAFGKHDAEKLLRLYAGEVEDLEAASAHLLDDVADDDAPTGFEAMTVALIKEYLDDKGVDYDPRAAKGVLVEIAEETKAALEAGAGLE